MIGHEVLRRLDELNSQKPETKPIDADTLIKLLLAFSNVKFKWFEWGKLPYTKKPMALVREIREGESVLIPDPEHKLIRRVNKVVIDVTYTDKDSNQFRLYEEFFDNGRWIIRENKGKNLKRGVQEKIKPEETPLKAALRGLREEIKTFLNEDEMDRLVFISDSGENRYSRGYPDLFTQYRFSDFTLDLPKRWYKPEGYIVKESGFKTRLVWEKI